MDGSSYAHAVAEDSLATTRIEPAISGPTLVYSDEKWEAHAGHLPCSEWLGKRALDSLGALILAIVLSPIILGIAAWLKFTGGQVLFGHQRIGRGGRTFKCLKFRSMVPNAEEVLEQLFERQPELRVEWLLEHKLKNDPRVTRFGSFIRKFSLDELPQLWNVIKGDMSLVGPRPIVRDEIRRYRRTIRHYFSVRPGITGLWQVSGRSDVQYSRRVAMDRTYARRSSLTFDFWILLKTVRVVFMRSGAY